MKKMKKSLALILSLVLLTMSLAACNSGDSGSSNSGSNGTGGSSTSGNETSGNTTGGNTSAGNETTGNELEPVTLTWYLHGSNVTDDAAVLEKANEYLKEKLNVTLKPIWGTWGDFDENVVLAINGGDNVDIYFTCSWSANDYTAYAKKGAFARLDDPDNNLLEAYAQDVWKELPEVLRNGASVNGSDGMGVYAIPGYKDIATQNCWDINVTLLKKYGYTVADIEKANYYEFGDILKTVKEGEEKENGGTFYPLLVEGAVLERMVTNSIIVTGDSVNNASLGYYLNPDDVSQLGTYGNTIFNKYSTPEYKKFIDKTREYFLAGYIDPSMGIVNLANSTRTEKQLTGEYLIGTQSYSLGYEFEAAAARNIEVAMVPVTEPYVDTTSSQGAMMAVSSGSQNKERAVMFLNLLNTDPELMTLLNYGVEGVHYEVVNGGEISFKSPGKRDDYQPWTNGMGNVTILPPLEGQGLNFKKEFKDYYSAASEIPILGWALNQDKIKNEIAALANVVAEYAIPLNTGTVDPETELPKFLEKLEQNGMQKVLDEANSQLSEYLANK